MVRVELVAAAFRMATQAPAQAADHSDPRGPAASSPEDVMAAEDPLIRLTRLVEMPAAPPTGAEMFVAPYPDRLVVEHTIWHADARAREPHVQVFLSPIDFDALGDKAEALAMLRGAGWDASS